MICMEDLVEIEILRQVQQDLYEGHVADLSKGELINMKEASTWGPERILSASFIRQLCTDPDMAKRLQTHGIRIRGARIKGHLDLNSLKIPFNISLNECSIPHALDLRCATVSSLDLSGSHTVSIDADGLTVLGNMRLADGFFTDGTVCLTGSIITGDLTCVRGHFDNQNDQRDTTKITGCLHCRENFLHAYALVLERAEVKGSLYLCGGFTAKGGVHLGDATIGVNLNCTKGEFTARTHEANLKGKTTGRRLPCESEADYHVACAFNGEGMHVKGNLILNEIDVIGEMRLTGAKVEGDLESVKGKYLNQGGNAIHGDRLHVHGNIFFCDGFKAVGIVRLARAEIGADLSFYNGNLTNSNKDSHVLYCEGISVKGTMYLNNFKCNDGYIDLSYSTVGGNLNCTDGNFLNTGKYSIKAKGMIINGSVFLNSSSLNAEFRADGLVSLTGSRLGMDLICTNGHFKSDKKLKSEENTPCAIMANNMSISGKVEMNGVRFKADGGVNLDDTKIGSFLKCDHGTFIAPLYEGNYDCAISAGKLQVGGSIYLENGFLAKGQVQLNDASIGRNLNCRKGKISKTNQCVFTLQALQMMVAGSVNLNNFVSHGEVRIDNSVIGGDLNCSTGEFISKELITSGQKSQDEESGKRYALRADGVNIAGSVLCNLGFHADGIVSLQRTNIGKDFSWTDVRSSDKASLFLDCAKVGVFKDDVNSWPKQNKLQINDFEYQFLSELSTEGLSKRREIWLSTPLDFRTQPFEHLAAVLKRSGYDEEARKVLIAKNDARFQLPVRPIQWKNLFHRGEKNVGPDEKTGQSQTLQSKIKLFLLKIFVCYGYKPFRAMNIGLAMVVFLGTPTFYYGFNHNLMVPLKDGGSYVYQIVTVSSEDAPPGKSLVKKPINIQDWRSRVVYSFFYSLDTFLPVVDFQITDYWLPSAYYPVESKPEFSGFPGVFLCCVRWVLIMSGWVISTVFLAAMGGIVRR